MSESPGDGTDNAPAPGSESSPGSTWGADLAPRSVRLDRKRSRVLLASVLVVATCGLVYELISATMAAYLLGDSVTQ